MPGAAGPLQPKGPEEGLLWELTTKLLGLAAVLIFGFQGRIISGGGGGRCSGRGGGRGDDGGAGVLSYPLLLKAKTAAGPAVPPLVSILPASYGGRSWQGREREAS